METKKPTHVKPMLYAFYFEALKEIAFKYGYNLLLHGSMNRDLDLVAIPWQEEIQSHLKMIEEMATCLGGSVLIEPELERQLHRVKKHGRECWVININRSTTLKHNGMFLKQDDHVDPQYYIDISVIPVYNYKEDTYIETIEIQKEHQNT